jgi:type I restriction enzyme S subunit
LRGIQIPVPSIAIQEEVTRILDHFEEMITDLSTGLPAELNARRKQYEYYRDKLLTFKEAA